MNIRIKTTNYQMPQDVSDYIDKKLEDLTKLIDESYEAARCDVEVGRAAGHPEKGNIWRAEMNLVYKGQSYRAESNAETVNAAIDEVKDEMTRQLRRTKRFYRSLYRRGGALLKRMMRFGRE